MSAQGEWVTLMKVATLLKDKKVQKWMWVGLSAFVAFQVYFVRELLAALLLFTVAFLVFAVIALVLYLLDQGSRWGFDRVSALAQSSLALAGHTWVRLEDLTKRQIHRIRSEPAR